MKKMLKKGFTIVELVIVIAVIAILSAVLIPTFAGVVKTAQTSSDISLVNNMNTILTTEKTLEGKNATMEDALEDVFDSGYDITKLTPTNSDNDILWDQENDRFVLYTKADNKYSSCGSGDVDSSAANLYKLWKIYTEMPETQTYSIYWNGGSLDTANVSVGFDAGSKNVAVVNYTNDDSAKEVIINMNGGVLNVGTDSAVAKGTVKQYGSVAEAVVYTENNSFHAYGKVASLALHAGRAVAKAGSYVTISKVAAATTVKEEGGAFAIPASATTADVDATVAATLGYTVTESGTTADESRKDKLSAVNYTISNKAELLAFRDAVNAGADFSQIKVVLTADIDMSGIAWTPIGNTSATAFSGSFDGQNHTISNLTSTHYVGDEIVNSSSGTSGSGLGLFGWGIKDVTVKNLKLSVYFNEYDSYIGGVMGLYIMDANNTSAANYAVNFENIEVSGIMAGEEKLGGIIGSTYASSYSSVNKNIAITLKNCVNNAKISGSRIGGLAGTISGQFADDDDTNNEVSVSFINCTNNQTAIVETGSTYKAGGIAGFMCSPGNYTFTNCSSVEIADGGKLFGRIQEAGGYSLENKENAEMSLGCTIHSIYGLFDTYYKTTIIISVVLNGGGTSYFKYTSGVALAEDEWRLTIDGKHYRCGVNQPINGAENCTEMTTHVGNPTLDQIEELWQNDVYEIDYISGKVVYIKEKIN